MKRYTNPEIEIKKFEVEDIITASGNSSDAPTADIDGGVVSFLEDWINSWTE